MQIGPYTLKNRLVVAPMAGVTDRPFRVLCKRMGAGMAVGEMLASNTALWSTKKSLRRADHRGEPDPIIVQIAGGDPAQMAEAARLSVQQGAQIIDINMGCPAKKVCNVAAGSALLRDEALVARILQAVVAAVDVPVTLKTRTGWSRAHNTALRVAKLASAAKAQGSPTIKLNGADYQGGRGPNDFMRAICNEIKGDKPQACKSIPEPVKVNMTILNDNRCQECVTRADRLIGRIKSTFPGLEVKKLDYMTPEGKALYTESTVKFLPAFLFDESVEKDQQGFQQFGRWLEPAGKFKNLKAGSNFDPTAEICDNKVDDNGDSKVDCDDATCTANLVCRKEIPKRLDLFVMSECPYGIKALNAMDEVLKNFKGSGLDFHINFIATKEGEGFKSLHGQGEVDEDIRELCAIKNYGKDNKYMDYIDCRNKNIKADWATCATKETGIDKAKIEKCFAGEGKKLLEENIKLGNDLQINASPTWLANNKKKFSGIDAESVRKNVCEVNKDLKGCEKTLSATNNSSSGGAACGQ